MRELNEKSPEEVFTALLKRLSAAELKSFLEEEAKRDELFLLHFIIRFIESSGFSSEEKYHQLYRIILQLASFNQEEFANELEKLVDRAAAFIEAKDFLDAFLIVSNLIYVRNELSKQAKEIYSQCRIKAFELLAEISNTDAGYDLKEAVFNVLAERAKKSAPDFSFAEKKSWLLSLIEAAASIDKLPDVLKLTTELIGENRSQFGESMDEEEEDFLLKIKLRLLTLLGKRNEAQHLRESHLHVKEFRLQLIDELIEQKDFAPAKELIKEGKREEQEKGKIYSAGDWELRLLKLAQVENDVKSIRNLALQLFLERDFDFEYYHLLRRQYDSARWNAQLDRIVNHIRLMPLFATNGIHAAAKIFIEERAWDKLLQLLQKNSNLENIDPYADFLKERFPAELLDLYRKAIRRFAEKNMGTEVYRMVTSTLRKMQSLPGGKEIVQSLAIELKVTYRQRKNFVDELNKVVL